MANVGFRDVLQTTGVSANVGTEQVGFGSLFAAFGMVPWADTGVSVPGKRKYSKRKVILPNGMQVEGTEAEIDRFLAQQRRLDEQRKRDEEAKREKELALKESVRPAEKIDLPSPERELAKLAKMEVADDAEAIRKAREQDEEDALIALLMS